MGFAVSDVFYSWRNRHSPLTPLPYSLLLSLFLLFNLTLSLFTSPLLFFPPLPLVLTSPLLFSFLLFSPPLLYSLLTFPLWLSDALFYCSQFSPISSSLNPCSLLYPSLFSIPLSSTPFHSRFPTHPRPSSLLLSPLICSTIWVFCLCSVIVNSTCQSISLCVCVMFVGVCMFEYVCKSIFTCVGA